MLNGNSQFLLISLTRNRLHNIFIEKNQWCLDFCTFLRKFAIGQNFTDKTDNGQAKIIYNADLFIGITNDYITFL